jgi:hypothetical protein
LSHPERSEGSHRAKQGGSKGSTDTYFSAGYQVARDDARFLMNLPDRSDYQLVVSPNWIAELRRKVRDAGGGR